MIEHPHRRYNQLTDEWVLVSPQRTDRPWQGQVEKIPSAQRPTYDPHCYLCPGNQRAGGASNPNYESTFVFTNDFSALVPNPPEGGEIPTQLLKMSPVRGTCWVICFSPRHDLTMREMPKEDIRRVVNVWAEQISELGEKYRWVQIFENKGALMGSSNPHPHGQIWASDQLPNEPWKEEQQQKRYFEENGSILLIDYVKLEQQQEERVVVENNNWIALVPFWAVWPFEILLLPKRHVLRLPDLSDEERDDLASLMKELLTKYDRLFDNPFSYSMGWHGAPNDKADYTHWQLHAHYYPPLLRSATVRKFIVGYELLGEVQRDLTAEQAAKRLREC
jgi:UDPglucose--hexose-1-phosphate uridylyltransferase